MAKGKLTAEEMFDDETDYSQTIDKQKALDLMRKFMRQEVEWYKDHIKKWEIAYEALQQEISIK